MVSLSFSLYCCFIPFFYYFSFFPFIFSSFFFFFFFSLRCPHVAIGGTTAEQAKALRGQYPHINFLVPGYGAQGAGPSDCLAFCREQGDGALISASRSIIYAYDNPQYIEQFGDNWEKCIEQACLDMKEALAAGMAAKAQM